ncbi:hypothetical protein GmHk_08G023919 [Glycine max]|nr:hypothetical protein GmHk_08G023919 [Glycine max]
MLVGMNQMFRLCFAFATLPISARALPIVALVNETFNKINDSFVTNDIKIMNMIKAGHRYSKDVYVMMQENQYIATSHYVRMYVQETGEFEVQEIANTRLDR